MASSSNPYSAARPKRAGDHFTRTHHLDSNEPSTKKPRFDPRNPSTLAPDNNDDEENDPTLDADVIGKSGGVKRNAVNIDGYDSDSSTENFDMRADARDKRDVLTPENDDDDMFAEDEPDDEPKPVEEGGGGKKKKKVNFLDDREIEGQEATSKSGGHVAVDFNGRRTQMDDDDDDESSSESGGDELRDMADPDLDDEIGAGGKKKHAPKLDAFNMKTEQQEGRFDESGNYVRKAHDPLATYDRWLEGVSKKDMKKAKEAHDKREQERRERERAADSIVTSDELSTMIQHLDDFETPMEALARYGKKLPSTTSSKKKTPIRRKKQHDMDVDDPADAAPENPAAAKAKSAIEAITDAAGNLTDRGIEDVYHLPRENLMRQFKRETGEDWKHPNPPPDPMWEFHWLTAPESDVNGPYDAATMRAWEAAGQFAAGAEFRRVGEGEWNTELDLD